MAEQEQHLFQFRWTVSDEPSIDDVVSRYDIGPDEVDRSYGVVKVADNGDGALYAILVDRSAYERLGARFEQEGADRSEGFFSNPRIDTFGPPEP